MITAWTVMFGEAPTTVTMPRSSTVRIFSLLLLHVTGRSSELGKTFRSRSIVISPAFVSVRE